MGPLSDGLWLVMGWGALVLFAGSVLLVGAVAAWLTRAGAESLRLVLLAGLVASGAGAASSARAQSEPWPGFTYCANEYGECANAPAGSVVRFGAWGTGFYATRTKIDGVPLYCSSEAFGGDSAPNMDKVCAYGAVSTPGQGASQPEASESNNPFYLTSAQGTAIFAAIFLVWAAAFTWRSVMDVLDTRGDRD